MCGSMSMRCGLCNTSNHRHVHPHTGIDHSGQDTDDWFRRTCHWRT